MGAAEWKSSAPVRRGRYLLRRANEEQPPLAEEQLAEWSMNRPGSGEAIDSAAGAGRTDMEGDADRFVPYHDDSRPRFQAGTAGTVGSTAASCGGAAEPSRGLKAFATGRFPSWNRRASGDYTVTCLDNQPTGIG